MEDIKLEILMTTGLRYYFEVDGESYKQIEHLICSAVEGYKFITLGNSILNTKHIVSIENKSYGE